MTEADDALQETWLRLSVADTDDVENMGGRRTADDGHRAGLPQHAAIL